MIKPLHCGEVRRLDAAASTRPGRRRAGASLPSSESAPADANAGDCLLLIGRVASAPAERAAELRPQSLRPTGAEVDDGFALHFLARVIAMIGERRVEAVAEEFDLIRGEAAFAADV